MAAKLMTESSNHSIGKIVNQNANGSDEKEPLQ